MVGMQIKLLQQSIQQARSDAEQAGEESRYILDELETPWRILQGHGPGGDLRKLLKQQQPSLLAWLLGPRTNVISGRVRQLLVLSTDTSAAYKWPGRAHQPLQALLVKHLQGHMLQPQVHA